MAFPMPVPPPVTMATWCCSKPGAKQLLPLTQQFMAVTRLSNGEQGKLSHRGHAHVTSRAPPRTRSVARVAPPLSVTPPHPNHQPGTPAAVALRLSSAEQFPSGCILTLSALRLPRSPAHVGETPCSLCVCFISMLLGKGRSGAVLYFENFNPQWYTSHGFN